MKIFGLVFEDKKTELCTSDGGLFLEKSMAEKSRDNWNSDVGICVTRVVTVIPLEVNLSKSATSKTDNNHNQLMTVLERVALLAENRYWLGDLTVAEFGFYNYTKKCGMSDADAMALLEDRQRRNQPWKP